MTELKVTLQAKDARLAELTEQLKNSTEDRDSRIATLAQDLTKSEQASQAASQALATKEAALVNLEKEG